jgi:hypothetical protein
MKSLLYTADTVNDLIQLILQQRWVWLKGGPCHLPPIKMRFALEDGSEHTLEEVGPSARNLRIADNPPTYRSCVSYDTSTRILHPNSTISDLAA